MRESPASRTALTVGVVGLLISGVVSCAGDTEVRPNSPYVSLIHPRTVTSRAGLRVRADLRNQGKIAVETGAIGLLRLELNGEHYVVSKVPLPKKVLPGAKVQWASLPLHQPLTSSTVLVIRVSYNTPSERRTQSWYLQAADNATGVRLLGGDSAKDAETRITGLRLDRFHEVTR